MAEHYKPKIVVFATLACAYPGADAVGKAHYEYPANIDVVGVPAPVMFPADFYLRSYSQGIDGILIAACGSDCPYQEAYTKLARRIDALVTKMKEGGLEIERMRLTAICTVCTKAFLKEVNMMNDKLTKLGPINRDLASDLWTSSLAERDHLAQQAQ